ncbi:MAG TPA: hypothetical protein VJ719_04055, partial [Chthoniobacterales bacterium]|nr:hypothetical protein [Chthoniobacterales bacterium]
MDSEVDDDRLDSEPAEEAAKVDDGEGVSQNSGAVDDVRPAKPAPPLDINALQDYSSEQLQSLARQLDLRLFPGRSRHQHILDLVRAGLGRGSVVTTEGFLEQGEAAAFLRSPRLNFLAVPEDVSVPRTLIQQYELRPGQQLAGTVRLPRDRERSLVLDQITTIEHQPVEQWTPPTDFEKLTPQFPQGRIMLEN